MFRTICLNIVLLLLSSSCSKHVLKRNHRGQRVNTNRNYLNIDTIKKKVSILAIFNESHYGSDDLAVTVTEELKKEVRKTNQFILDPTGIKLYGSSKEVYSGGGVKLTQLARKARIAGLNIVVFGRIVDAKIRQKQDEIGIFREIKSYSEVKLELKMFDVIANKEIFSEVLNGYTDDKTFKLFSQDRDNQLLYRRELLRYTGKVAVRMALPKIIAISEKLDWMGRIAKVIGSKIYINAGRSSGIQISDILKVMTEGQEIYDPETGSLIGISAGEVKGTIEIIDYFGPDGAIAVLHSGGSVLEGDFVQLY
jgi:hypothetical protein